MKPIFAVAVVAFLLGFTPWALAQSVSTIAVGNHPTDIAFDRTYLHVSNYDDGTVSKINPKTGAVVKTYPAGGHPAKVFYDGTYIWTTNGPEGTVSKLSTAGVLQATYPVGTDPKGITYDGKYMWVTLAGEAKVIRISRSTGAVLGMYAVGSTPYSILYDGAYIWVVNGPYMSVGSVTKLSKIGAVLGTFSTNGTTARAIAANGEFIYVSNFSSGEIVKLRKTDGALVNSLQPGVGAHGILYEGHQIWTMNNEGKILRFNTDDDSLLSATVVTVGTVNNGPFSVGFDGVRVWSVNWSENTVSAF
jgi:YVTN family beta-propeller protein